MKKVQKKWVKLLHGSKICTTFATAIPKNERGCNYKQRGRLAQLV